MRRFWLHEDYQYKRYDFHTMLDFCDQSARYFTFIQHGQGCINKSGKTYRSFLKELKKHKVYQFHSYGWYPYEKPRMKWYDLPIRIGVWKKILVYEFNSQSRETLANHFQDLFLGWNGWPADYPEDIAFFREDRSLLLGTVSHESFAEIYLTEQEFQEIKLPEGFVESVDRRGWEYRKLPLNRRDQKDTF